ncbi:sigma-70 family RNA polymerase sigma factor [Rathayibacter sp. SD072]|uniref:sigma-70 family RNA polymerase sigma factor n=1 Tax=Rathayibacter sp. SD072 TaxID=2781731 RepID=UPI001A97BEB8|nr:sigma-70 family RNA polymerase sigma factor [Rathayibacter sp. SD072]
MEPTTIRDEATALGHLGPAAFKMMTSVFTAEVPRFPGLVPPDEIGDLINGFFEDKNTGYVDAVVAAPTDAAATRLTRKWAERWLVDRVRRLPWGALRNRLEKRLERSPLFAPCSVAHYWREADGEDADRPFTHAQLRGIALAAHVDVTVPPGGGPVTLGRAGQLEELIRQLLRVAGRLSISDITRVCADRFPSVMLSGDAHRSVVDPDVSEFDNVYAAYDSVHATLDHLSDAARASALLPSLTPRERIIIRHSEDMTALADALGVGRSSAYTALNRLRARLIELAGDDERGMATMKNIIGLVLDEDAPVPSSPYEDLEDSRAS